MKIVILRSAVRDLAGGYQFYARQGEGLGEYFEESLLADIESLRLYAGIHRKVHDFHRLLSIFRDMENLTSSFGPKSRI